MLPALCEGYVTGGFPSQRASNTCNVSISWCHHDKGVLVLGRISLTTFGREQNEISFRIQIVMEMLWVKYDNKVRTKLCARIFEFVVNIMFIFVCYQIVLYQRL